MADSDHTINMEYVLVIAVEFSNLPSILLNEFLVSDDALANLWVVLLSHQVYVVSVALWNYQVILILVVHGKVVVVVSLKLVALKLMNMTSPTSPVIAPFLFAFLFLTTLTLTRGRQQ